MSNIFELYTIPFDQWVTVAIDWLVNNYRDVFQLIKWPLAETLNSMEAIFLTVPPLVLVILVFIFAWLFISWKVGLFSAAALLLAGFIGAWSETMTTLSQVITAVLFCTIIGIPLGIAAARSDHFEALLRPLLDTMQTTPAFVYLVPIVMLFGIGNVPGIIVTIIFAIPPIIRFTNLGLRQVSGEILEAAYAFGAKPMEVLREIQFPLALPTIMAGLNQTLMLALSMVVIASMIAVEGLGMMVLRGIGRLDVGVAAVGGLGIVLLAIILDRITQGLSKGNPSSGPHRQTLIALISSRIAHSKKTPMQENEESPNITEERS